MLPDPAEMQNMLIFNPRSTPVFAALILSGSEVTVSGVGVRDEKGHLRTRMPPAIWPPEPARARLHINTHASLILVNDVLT